MKINARCVWKVTIVSDGHDHKHEKDKREPSIIIEQIDGTSYTFDTENCALMFKKLNAVYGNNFSCE